VTNEKTITIMNAEHNAIFRDFLTNYRATQFGFLAELVRVPTDRPDQDVTAFLEMLASHLKTYDFEVTLHGVPEELCASHGFAPLTNVIARRSFGPGPTVALVANVDTSLAGDGWNQDPFAAKIVDGKMYGRGVVSAKGALAAYVFAARALSEVKDKLSGTVELHISFDGEADGDLGSGWLLSEKLVAPDFAICPGNTHSLMISANGILQLEVEIRGRRAPASRPEDGRDALEAASRVMSSIYGLRDENAKIKSEIPGINPPSALISEIQGGEYGRSVSERCMLTITRSLIPEEDAAKVENQITNRVGIEVTRVPGVLCKIRRKGLSRPLIANETTQIMVDHFQAQAPAVFDAPLPEVGTPHGTLARHYAAAGIPTVLYGVGPAKPSQAQVGAANEVLDLDDLRKSTELLSYVLADILKTKT